MINGNVWHESTCEYMTSLNKALSTTGVYAGTEYDMGETIVTDNPCRRW